MFVFRRPVRFADVDAARMLFFARFLDYCHDALEALFGELPGGYPAFVRDRDLGIPTVHLEVDFHAPLRYGDVARFEIGVARIGRTSVTFRHRIRRDADDTLSATILHVVVLARLSSVAPQPVPPDLRAVLERYQEV